TLVMKKSKTLGLLISGITHNSSKDNLIFEALCGMNDRAGELGYDLILFSTNPYKQKEKSYQDLCKERGVDGLIVMGLKTDDPYLHEVVNSPIPTVLIDIPLNGKNVGYVTSDNEAGAKKAVSYLLNKGHRKIAMMNGHPHADVSIRRLEGYRQALEEAGLPYDPDLVYDGKFTENGAMEAAYPLFYQHPEVTAVFCASDLMAIGTMQALNRMGKKVPEEVSIVGFDDIVLAQYMKPALTTIHQNFYEMGHQAAQLLVDLLERRKVKRKVILATHLVERESVASR
ncbi:MAG: substrate-binding domain-containing protein, partial [Thermicanus sp.]|nr:substrate-binding domain-containing protein [Thermicanus sp.]